MGLISKLISMFGLTPQTCYHQVQDIMRIPTTFSNGGQFDLELVGESNYKTRIWSMLPNSITEQEIQRAYFVGKINLEDDNQHDKQAVNFTIDGRVVGYFSRMDARKFRKMIHQKDLNAKSISCRSVVVGGKNKDYGIWLEINLTDTK